MSAFWKLFVGNLKDLLRDRMSTFWFLAFPVLFIFLFGFIFAGSGESSATVGLAMTPGDPLAEGVAQGFKSVSAFQVHQGSLRDELDALKKGGRDVVVAIPADAARTAAGGQQVTIAVYYDKGREQTGQMLHSIVAQVISEVEARMTGRPRLLLTKLTPFQTAKLKNIDFLLPGILAMALMQLGLFGALQIVSLREQKVLKGLGATPLPRLMIIGSEVLVRLLMSLIQMTLIVTIGVLVFKVHITGNWLAVVGIVLLGSITFISMGYMLASFARTVEAGQGLVQLVQFPMMFLSGIFFPVQIMPDFLRPVVKAMPLTYLGDALRQVMVGMAPDYPLLLEIGILGAWLVVSMILSVVLWRWE